MEKRILVLLAINDNLLALNQLLAFASSLFIFLNNMLTLFRMGIFGAAHGWGPQKSLSSLKSVTHILQ